MSDILTRTVIVSNYKMKVKLKRSNFSGLWTGIVRFSTDCVTVDYKKRANSRPPASQDMYYLAPIQSELMKESRTSRLCHRRLSPDKSLTCNTCPGAPLQLVDWFRYETKR